MKPQIRHAKTSDGVNIAYYAIGPGSPFVWLPTPPECRPAGEAAAGNQANDDAALPARKPELHGPRVPAVARATGAAREREGQAIDKVISGALLMLAAVLAIAALSNTIMPAVGKTAGALISAADLAGPKITNVIEITEVTAIDQGTVEVWAKNVGSQPVVSPAQLIVQVGPETNMPHIPYGGVGCSAPCWGYALQHGDTWARGTTIEVRVYLVDALLPDTRYFAALTGVAGGQARREFRVGDQVPTRTPTPTLTATPMPTPTPTPTP